MIFGLVLLCFHDLLEMHSEERDIRIRIVSSLFVLRQCFLSLLNILNT